MAERELTKHTIEGVRDFDAERIFECGQCFRFSREQDGSYTGVASGCFANISYNNEEDAVTIWSDYMPGSDALKDRFWRDFLDLNRDYAEIKRFLSDGDPVMAKATERSGGLRVLNQEPWEALISFIVSQNSNIPRIRACIEALCSHFGKKIGEAGGKPFYAFPSIRALAAASEADLEPCKLGYRSRYIAEAARQVDVDGGAFLSTAHTASAERAEAYLRTLSGVGPKVAHCVMLFSLKKADAFPIDVWIARAMNQLYGIPEEDHEAMHAYAAEHFSPYGGIAQMYLFDYVRNQRQ